MKEKQQEIIRILKKTQVPISSAQLALQLQLSIRSVKSYIKELNQQIPGLIQASQKGYRINEQIVIPNTIASRSDIPQTQQERIRYSIKAILNSEGNKERLHLYDLADEIFISPSTMKRDLVLAQALCEKYKTTLCIQEDFLSICGKEQDKRNLMVYLYTQEFEQCHLDLDRMKQLFPQYDAYRIKAIIIEKCQKHHYVINGYAMNNIVLDTLISFDRISHAFVFDTIKAMPSLPYHERELAKEITQEFEQLYHITYQEEDLIAFTTLLFSHLLRVDYQEMTLQDLKTIVGEDTYLLAEEIIKETKEYFLKNRSEDFFKRFTLHLSNLLLRAKHNQINHNVLTETIKNSCPLLFDCAVHISTIIYEKTGYTINDDEIAYIALHIGSLLGEEENQKLNCALFMHPYYDFSLQLQKKLQERFASRIAFTFLYETSDFHKEAYDMILSTYPLPWQAENDYLLITSLLTEKDCNQIEAKLEEIEKHKLKLILINQLLAVTSANFFYRNPDVHTKEELIHLMVEQLYQHHYVGQDYETEVLYREQISSTSFNRIAVPHSLKMSAYATMISIALFDKPIAWGNKQVSIVFLFAINERDMDLFHHIFDHLITLLVEEQHVYQVLQSETYEAFVDKLSSIA